MAEVLKKFEFKTRGESNYEWAKYLDGRIHKLSRGAEGSDEGDYDCKTLSFAAMARGQAEKRGLGIRVSQDEDFVVLQAFELTEEQKEARELARAERKATRAANKANGGSDDGESEGEDSGDENSGVETEEVAVVEEEEAPKPAPKKGKGR